MTLYLTVVDVYYQQIYNVFSSYELANNYLNSFVKRLAIENPMLKNLTWEQAIIASDYDMYFEITKLTLDTQE
jgi:hypothetical protein